MILGFPLCGSLLPRHVTSTGCGWKIRPADRQGNCECIE